MARKKSKFRGKVGADAKKQQKSGSSYGYLNLPKGISVFSPKPDTRVKLDFLPYEVTDKLHPDRDVDKDIAMVGDLWYKRPFKIHRSIGSENDKVICLTSVKKKCPICEYVEAQLKAGVE